MSNLENLSEEQTAPSEGAASDDTSFADILSQFEQEHREPSPGETLHGTVVTVTPEAVIVDIGRKMEGIIPVQGLRDAGHEQLPQPGEQIVVSVSGRSPEGYYELSTLKVERPKDWSGLQAAFDEKRTIAGVVAETVKGGLRVDIGVRAFMPASRSGVRDVADLEKLVGQEIQCRITKLDVAKEDVVVDRRVVLEEEEKKSRETFFSNLQEGQVLTGTVRSLMEYGAFVDIGGVDGLLHVADISWARIGKPADVLRVGERVEVRVLKINRDTRKISLGMKQLQADPWTVAAEKYKPGQRVTGTVARLTDFGAFVALEPGIDGLVHVSELSWSKKIRRPSDVLKVGEQVEVAVLGVNAAEHRISLGLKQALGDPWEAVQEKFPVGSVVEGTITNMANFGAFVDLGEGIEGMIHVGDITREKRLDHPKDVLKTGEKVRAAVLEIDRERRRIRLGLKQLEPTGTDNYIAEHHEGDTVTGRVVEVRQDRAKIDLGEGVFGTCRLPVEPDGEATPEAERPTTGIEELTARLAAKWKQGGAEPAAGAKQNQIKPGQVRTFRITGLDPGQKKIQLEMLP
jgi:small subunit ribosomal protein S1